MRGQETRARVFLHTESKRARIPLRARFFEITRAPSHYQFVVIPLLLFVPVDTLITLPVFHKILILVSLLTNLLKSAQ
jgi:hypothetical protein